jgi:hypothetical protein
MGVPASMRRWQVHESALVILGLATLVTMVGRAGLQAITFELAIANIAFVLMIVLILRFAPGRAGWQRLRLFAAYFFVLWFFSAVRRMVPALHLQLHDVQLLEIDRRLFGETPAAMFATRAWVTALLSLAYLAYLVYLHAALLRWGAGDLERARRFWNYLFLAYAVGFAGYLLVPAIGPQAAFPELFTPLPCDNWAARLNAEIVSRGSAVYDVFPSLHVLITCVVLDFDYRQSRKVFYCMLPVVGLIFLSTLYLRYHYAIDLIAGALCFAVVRFWFNRWEASQDSVPSVARVK